MEWRPVASSPKRCGGKKRIWIKPVVKIRCRHGCWT
jgi:hypothetical protein